MKAKKFYPRSSNLFSPFGSRRREGQWPRTKTNLKKIVLELFEEGWTDAEIAAELGCAISTPQKIRAALKRDEDE